MFCFLYVYECVVCVRTRVRVLVYMCEIVSKNLFFVSNWQLPLHQLEEAYE